MQPAAAAGGKNGLGVPRTLAIAMQVGRALAAAHRNGIVHRDIKPENILVSATDEIPETVKVLDFGIAKLREGSICKTQAGLILGTPRYMSFEQASGVSSSQLDGRSDLYSLGNVIEAEDYGWPLALLVPGVLQRFDLPDCYRELERRTLRLIEPADARLVAFSNTLAFLPEIRESS